MVAAILCAGLIALIAMNARAPQPVPVRVKRKR